MAFRPMYRRIHVFSTHDLPRHSLGAHYAKRAPGNRQHEARHHGQSMHPWGTKPVWELSTAPTAAVCLVVPLVIASRPIQRRVRLLNTRHDATDNPQTGVASHDRRDRSWWRASCCRLFGVMFSLACPKHMPGDIMCIENTILSTHWAISSIGITAQHHGSECRKRPLDRSSIPRWH